MQLSPSYQPIEERIVERVVIPTQGKLHKSKLKNMHKASKEVGKCKTFFYTMRLTSPLRYRFVHFHGKGSLVRGHIHYEKYYDSIYEKTQNIIKTLSDTRNKSKFSDHIGICQTLLSNYNSPNTKSKFITKLQVMRRIVRGFETYELK